ncbi:serine hydrolase domain-containing protein [Microterricola viridarii]|uniref:CubicO group peptidase, beta-lactamase class C family n=1 Tax=Microterricola viridarii TaxID=412690 RepID=A0A1H1MFV7_9MICO|nr:serine hydrolase domain-containing protein [Microterricola viridarii]SDR85638.1 CubicO group peptidase, beta-lactamase class C family [Microterricola viridarii]
MRGFAHAVDWARSRVAAGALPTAVLGIASANGVHELAAFGASGGRPAHVDDHFPLFSVTKPLLAMTALREVERGRLALTDALSGVLPEFGRNRSDSVELRHLLNHSSGIAEPPLHTPGGLRRSLLTASADFAAGTATRYSSIAFEGIAAMTQHAAGRPWEHAVSAVMADAGAHGVTFDAACEPHPIYGADDVGLDYTRFQELRHPGAGAYARARDLLALGQALLRQDPTVLHPATLAAMLRPTTARLFKLPPYTAELGQDWGHGWNLRHSAPGLLERSVYGHGGWNGTEFWVYPTLNVCFVLLTNRMAPDRNRVNVDQLHNAVVVGAR